MTGIAEDAKQIRYMSWQCDEKDSYCARDLLKHPTEKGIFTLDGSYHLCSIRFMLVLLYNEVWYKHASIKLKIDPPPIHGLVIFIVSLEKYDISACMVGSKVSGVTWDIHAQVNAPADIPAISSYAILDLPHSWYNSSNIPICIRPLSPFLLFAYIPST